MMMSVDEVLTAFGHRGLFPARLGKHTNLRLVERGRVGKTTTAKALRLQKVPSHDQAKISQFQNLHGHVLSCGQIAEMSISRSEVRINRNYCYIHVTMENGKTVRAERKRVVLNRDNRV